MIVVDSSVAVAAHAEWHESYVTARNVLAEHGPSLVAHAALEAYSVLTRLPAPLRVAPAVAHAYLAARFAPPGYPQRRIQSYSSGSPKWD